MQRQTYKFFLITFFIIVSSQTLYSPIKTIIFSFNTLFRADVTAIEKHIRSQLRLRNYLSLLFKGIPSKQEVKDQLFSMLNDVPIAHYLTNINEWETAYPSYETTGHKFPPIFCQLLTSSTFHDEQIIFNTIINHLDNRSGIHSKTRRTILKATIETIFQSQLMNKFVNPLHVALNFAEELQNRGYQIILIGNVPGYAWDRYLRDYPKAQAIKELFPEDHQFISGKLGILKSSETMYNLIIETHNLNPHECLVIDSNYLNLNYPRTQGLQTLVFDAKNDNFNQFKNNVNLLVA